MKKTALLTLVFAFFYLPIFAQKGNYWGFKTGLNISEIQGPVGSDFDLVSKAGFHLSPFANFYINENFAIQGELSVSQMGGKDTPEDIFSLPIEPKYTLKMNYLALPLSLQIRRRNFFSELGFMPALQLNRKVKVFEAGINEREVSQRWDSNFDLGLLVGVGYHYRQYEVSIRAIPGLLNVSSIIDKAALSDELIIPGNRTGRNMLIQVGVGFRVY